MQAKTGDWNFSGLGGKSKAVSPGPSTRMPLDLSVKLVKITNGRLTMSRSANHGKPVVLEQVEINLQNFSTTAAFPFSLAGKVAGGGSVKLTGTAGPLNSADMSNTPVNAFERVVLAT